jgi:hypothetical protein
MLVCIAGHVLLLLLQLDGALLDLSSYSHLAFTSKNGILAVLERLSHLKGGRWDHQCLTCIHHSPRISWHIYCLPEVTAELAWTLHRSASNNISAHEHPAVVIVPLSRRWPYSP